MTTKEQERETAPPQTPEGQAAAAAEAQGGALAVQEGAKPASRVADRMRVLAVAGADGKELERVELSVTIPAEYQYAITHWKKAGDVTDADYVVRRGESGGWVEVSDKTGVTADGYDYLNRALGASFFMPQYVHDEQGEQRRNPIHRKDYIYLRLAAVYYNPLGQLVMTTEDVEVDFTLLWMDRRANAKSAEVQLAAEGGPLFDALGQPALRLTKEDELKALKELTRNRAFGPRYAITVARVRLLKQATGIRSLPIPYPADMTVKVVGFRDQLTPRERIEASGGDVAYLFGKEADIEPLKGADAAAAAQDATAEPDEGERQHVAESQAEPEPAQPAEVRGEGGEAAQPTAEEQAAVALDPDGLPNMDATVAKHAAPDLAAARDADEQPATEPEKGLEGTVLDAEQPDEKGEPVEAPWAK